MLRPADWIAWLDLAEAEGALLRPLPAGALAVETVRGGDGHAALGTSARSAYRSRRAASRNRNLSLPESLELRAAQSRHSRRSDHRRRALPLARRHGRMRMRPWPRDRSSPAEARHARQETVEPAQLALRLVPPDERRGAPDRARDEAAAECVAGCWSRGLVDGGACGRRERGAGGGLPLARSRRALDPRFRGGENIRPSRMFSLCS